MEGISIKWILTQFEIVVSKSPWWIKETLYLRSLQPSLLFVIIFGWNYYHTRGLKIQMNSVDNSSCGRSNFFFHFPKTGVLINFYHFPFGHSNYVTKLLKLNSSIWKYPTHFYVITYKSHKQEDNVWKLCIWTVFLKCSTFVYLEI